MKSLRHVRRTAMIAVVACLGYGTAPGQFNQTFTTTADFQSGNLLNLNTSTPDQLQLNAITQPRPFIWVACSDRGTVVRIDVNTGTVLGEYKSSPDGRGRNPSRTTVDLFGNVWVGNRAESNGGMGSVIKIGLVIGGTRGDRSGSPGSYIFTPNPSGQYLAPPFDYNTCIDRDGDGLIKTSNGLGNILAWSNSGGADNNGGVSTAEDECILIYARTTATEIRHVSIDANNDVWVGGFPGYAVQKFNKLNGNTGAIVATFPSSGNVSCGGYGGVIDGNGVLWSASLSYNTLLRYDIAGGTSSCIGSGGYNTYGIGIDNNGYIWNALWTGNRINKISPAGVVQSGYPKLTGGSGSRGVAITRTDNNVWIANSYSGTVTRLDNDGNLRKTISVGSTPTGVAVDANGKVWVTNYDSHNVMRIDPDGGVDNLGAVDLTVSLGSGAGPYNYSDMTGQVAIGTTTQQGTWSKTIDGGMPNLDWEQIIWHGETPTGTGIKVEVRADNNTLDLAGLPFTEVTNGGLFKVSDGSIVGQYLEVRVTLSRGVGIDATPTLFDITIRDLADVRLPVELTGFSLSAGNDKVRLAWRTASEVNNRGFEIERAIGEEGTFTPLASYLTHPELAGLGTSSRGRDYSYIDAQLQPGLYQYRLVDVSTDGIRTEHPAKMIRVEAATPPLERDVLRLAPPTPNPAGNDLTISFTLPDAAAVTIEIYAGDGRLITAPISGRSYAPGNYGETISTRGLAAGTYTVRLIAGSQHRVQRLVVLR